MDKLERLYNEWLALQPLDERKAYLLNQRFTVDYNFNSNHIEGNTLTYGQTEILLLFGRVSGEGVLEHFDDMKASHVAVNMTRETARERKPLTQTFIRQLHHVILREDYTVERTLPGGVVTSYTVHAGRYKTRPNSVITRYGDRFEYAAPEETAALMTDLVDWYNSVCDTRELSVPDLAALFHYRFIRIHPFEDGNGRMARLLVNYILTCHGWPGVVVRNRDKGRYLEALHTADVAVGPVPSAGAAATAVQASSFIRYFRRLMATELQYNIDFARETSPQVWWHDGIRLTLRSATTPVLLHAMRRDPDITIEALAREAGIVTAAVKKQLRTMTDKGYIERLPGSGWHVFATASV